MTPNTHNNVFFEYFPSNSSHRKAMVILTGVPGKPKKYDIFERFNQEGFDVFFPRYEGTWESKGNFLSPSPVVAIDSLIEAIHNGITLTGQLKGQVYKSDEVFVLGSSFGGGVALVLQDHSIQ